MSDLQPLTRIPIGMINLMPGDYLIISVDYRANDQDVTRVREEARRSFHGVVSPERLIVIRAGDTSLWVLRPGEVQA